MAAQSTLSRLESGGRRANLELLLPLARPTACRSTTWSARPRPATPGCTSNPGHEWLYVLSGRLRLRLGDEEHVLSPGEVAEFDCRLPHTLLPADDQPVEAIVLFGPDGERTHVRLSGSTRR